jgi:hypothetical protein
MDSARTRIHHIVRRAIGVVMVIWKFALEVTDTQRVFMPNRAKILSAAHQNGYVCIWAMVNPDRPLQERVIEIIGTGNPFPAGSGIDRKFIGTVVANPFVWHVFERCR